MGMRRKRFLFRDSIEKSHCQGEWLNVCNYVEICRSEFDRNQKHAELKHTELDHEGFKLQELKHEKLKNAELKHQELKNAELKHQLLKNAELKHQELKNADHGEIFEKFRNKHLDLTRSENMLEPY